MGLPVIETPATGAGCCAKPATATVPQPCCAGAAATAGEAPRQERSTGTTFALLVAGLVAWTVAYRLVFPLSELLTYRVLGLARDSHLGQSVAFFLYDAPKVLLLLVLIVFGVGTSSRSSRPSAPGFCSPGGASRSGTSSPRCSGS